MTTIQFKRANSAVWQSKNPVLSEGEPGYESDTRRFKIGDGLTPWAELAYAAGGSSSSSDDEAMLLIQAHINSLTPHTVYDDGPSLALLYQNAKV